ncbi:MAG: YfhO family protein [Lachnospiraceae bacterium]|nr:YfhO family protein [Lachnospiraceae bacterium]
MYEADLRLSASKKKEVDERMNNSGMGLISKGFERTKLYAKNAGKCRTLSVKEAGRKSDILWYGRLLVVTCMLLFVPMGSGNFFGSDGDWLSQHVGIAESLRQAIIENHTLLPQYIGLGGGSSLYDYAYYGVLRPDVVFSCLIPNVEMKYVIAGYAALGVISSVMLMFFWLRKKSLSGRCAFGGTLLFACATCFYHAHHQIMFVNYMPFLVLALIGADRIFEKKRCGLFITALFFIYIHSFYYAIACLFVAALYFLHCVFMKRGEEGVCVQKRFCMFAWSVVWSIAMAMVLLLPTGLDILSTSKDGGSFAGKAIHIVDFRMTGLLYNPYGCGMTLLALYCLLVCLRIRRKRFLAAGILISMGMPVVSLLLNGFLYARAKILIPFLPLLVFVIADTLKDFWEKKEKHSILALLLSLIPAITSVWKPLIIIDGCILCIWIFLQGREWKKGTVKGLLFGLAFFAPILVSLSVNASDFYLRPVMVKLGIPMSGSYITNTEKRQEHFTREEIEKVVTDNQYRFDVTANCFVNSNLTVNGTIKRTSMYSSISNAEYSRFYYDTMKNAIPINNRVALVPGVNPFFNYFMGVKYVLVKKGHVPEGYEARRYKNGYVLAEKADKNVLPVCYGTTALMSKADYEKLPFPENLEALCSYTVVDVINDKKCSKFSSHFKVKDITELIGEEGKQCLLNMGEKEETIQIPLKEALSDHILVIQFHVKREDGNAVEITVNGTKNKLSSVTAPYPNGNDTFTYILESGKNMEQLEVMASKGNYRIEELKCYLLAKEYIEHKNVTLAEQMDDVKTAEQKQESKWISQSRAKVWEGSIKMEQDGYITTSFPYRRGYQITVDGKKVNQEVVNTAFLGFPIGEGMHQIEISYEAPGYRLGLLVSLCAVALAVWKRCFL